VVALAELERTMSLLNQVLRNLDERQSPAAAALPTAKAATRATAAGPAQRAKRWILGGVATAVAVVAGGWAQGSLSWPTSPPAPVVARAVAPAPAPVTPPAIEPAQPVATASPAAVAVPAAPALPAPAPTRFALAAPSARPALAPRPDPAPKAVKAPAADTATAAPKAEARIDKRSTGRTSQERAEAHYQRGVTAHQAGQFNDSADAFTAALREDPRHAPARQAQAGLLIAVSRQSDAVTLLQEGLALAPQQPALSLMLARLQAERQETDLAIATLQAALPSATGHADYLGTYAAILQRANRHAEASQQFGAALRLAPANAVWWMGLGMSLSATDQHDAAREAFGRAKAIGLPPEAAQYVDARLRQLM
jgi:MSHA biogenesis protein MshN